MGLIPKWHGTMALPPLPERRLKVSGNWVIQQPFRGAVSRASVSDSQYPGHDQIELRDLAPPFNLVLLRQKGARRVEVDLPVVTVQALPDASDPTPAALTWDSRGLLEKWGDTPAKVRKAWINKFDFRSEDAGEGIQGLRAPQIGALHAISAHFAVGRQFDAATVVLPTGTGKTETMLATQVYRRLERSLVLVPSDALRRQIAKKFISLGVLPQVGVVPADTAGPRVAMITAGIRSADDARTIVDNANVIVALPNSLQASAPEAIAILTEACSDLIVDEAHHISAATWASIRDRFAEKRVLQFTATPFRQDKKRIDGKIIFNYKLGDAQAAGYYRQINLLTVEEYGDDAARDAAIATAAIAALRRDRAAGLDHLLMARTKSKARADDVWALYTRLAPDLTPLVVYSGPGQALANRNALEALIDRDGSGSFIIVCVDMLGEGFDLPNLKIAALHDTHKSLAITLQFIGRFTRTGAIGEIGEATVVTNIADPDAEAKLAELYAEGADWDQLIKRLSEERIDQELDLQEVVYALKEKGDLHAHLSLWNLKPALSGQFYRTKCEDWNPNAYRSVLPKKAESWFALSEDNGLLVAVVSMEKDVAWGDYNEVFNTIYDLVILKWDKAKGSLCVFASDYDGLSSEKMAKAVTSEETELIRGTPIFNILNNVELPLVKSLGSSRIGAISFTSYFGPNVTDGLALIEKAQSELNNIACLGYEDGERVIWGGTQRRGKIWQQKRGTVPEWIAWTTRTFDKISKSGGTVSNIVRDFLRPTRLDRPHNSHPISVQWGEQAQMRFNDRQFVTFGTVEMPVYQVDLDVDSIEDDGSINISISTEEFRSVYRLVISAAVTGGYRHEHVSGSPLLFRKSSSPATPIADYLESDPLIIRYVDGTYSYNCYHIPTNLQAGEYPRERIETWDWANIPLNRESMHKAGDRNTIQYRAFETIRDDYDLIFNDDGSGEAADLVCLKEIDEKTILLTLVHCKGAYEGRVSTDIRNFYTVCGQAQKSITVKHGGVQTLYYDLKRRHELWAREGASRFLKGDMKTLSYFKEKARRSKLDFEVILVQPGASSQTVSSDALKLLATTELFLSKTTEATFRFVSSP